MRLSPILPHLSPRVLFPVSLGIHLSLVPPDSTHLSKTVAIHMAGSSLSLQGSEDSLSSEGLPMQAWGQWVVALREMCLKFGRP